MNKLEKINVLGIGISNFCRKDILNKIKDVLAGKNFVFFTTPNPEIILKSHEDEEYFYILNQADFSIPDAMGISLAGLLLGVRFERFSGADLCRKILQIANDNSRKILIVNWAGGLSDKNEISGTLMGQYSGLNHMIINAERERESWKKLITKEVVAFQPDIVFCLLGAPWQEKFIYHEARKIPSVRLAIGIGGAFDFLTGKIKRAPLILQKLGLEWFWRLCQQPWRLKRIFNAVAVFTIKLFYWRFVLPFRYRDNVVCILYKKSGEKKYILLVERSDDHGHWQLPQGGKDGQSIEKAGKRELSEELNCTKFKTIKSFPKLYRYEFSNDVKTSGDGCGKLKHYGYKGQKQGLYIAEFTGNNDDIAINFWDHSDWRWVESESLPFAVFRYRQESARKFLKLFNETVE